MKLKFVSDDVVRSGGGRRSVYPWAEFIEELYKHPNRWAEFPMQIPHSAIAYRIRDKYADIEVTITGGNNLSSDHPDKRYWTVYLAYTPKTGPQNGK